MRLFLVALAFVLPTACKGSDKGNDSAKSSATPPGPLVYTTGDTSIAGDYDGTKAILTKSGSRSTFFVAKNCPAFGCANISSGSIKSDTLKTTCPQGAVLAIEVEKDLARGSKQPISSAVCSHGDGSANGLVLSGAEANELEVLSTGDPVVAKVALQGMESLKGIVAAKACQ